MVKTDYFKKNYIPISLLNCVYKISSSAISNRIKHTLDKLIHRDQSRFIAGRYMGENTRLIYDIMKYTELNDIPGLILLIDFEKAFDSVSWSFIFKVLKFFKFGDSLISWIKFLYKDATLAVSQCGHLSNFFNIERGCRQGDPLSPYLFILCAEVLEINIRNNKTIKGISVDNHEIKLSQYADDTSILLYGSELSLKSAFSELSK